MADWNTGRRIAISGAVFGQPSSDRNQSLTYSELYGTGGIDGLFGEIITQWPEAMTGYGDSREAATSAMIVPIPCGATDDDTDGNESPEETRFNNALYEMVNGGRLGVEAGDGVHWSHEGFLAWVHEAIWFGFAMGEPYFDEDSPGNVERGRVVIRPLMRAAIQRLQPDLATGAWSTVWYQQSMPSTWVTIPYEDLLHVAFGGVPGQAFGEPQLRSLAGPFHAWRSNLSANSASERASRGRAVVTEPPMLDDTAAMAIDAWLASFDDDRARSTRIPNEAGLEVLFPSGSQPDFSKTRADMDRYAQALFRSRISSLGILGAGSRATAEVLAEADAHTKGDMWARLLNRAYMRFGEWVARQTGYAGRIRSIEVKPKHSEEELVDVALLTQALPILEANGGLTSDDVDRIRKRIGLQPLGVAQLASIRSPAARAVAPNARTPIIASLAESDSFAPPEGVREEAAKGLAWRQEHGRGGTAVGVARARDLVNGNVSGDTVKRMVSFFARHEVNQTAEGWSPGEDGFPSAGRIAWALWGGDAGKRWAEKIRDQLDANLSERCGCASCANLSESAIAWAGRDGRSDTRWRLPLTLTVDGVEYTPELAIALGELDDIRDSVDASLRVAVLPIIEEHRAATWEALAAGYDRARSEALWASYRARYESAILSARAEMRQAGIEQASAERASSDVRDTQRPGGLTSPEAAEWLAEQEQRSRLQARLAAETLASRVQTYVETAYAAGTTPATFVAQQTLAGLLVEASAVVAREEATSTVREAIEEAPDGLVVIAAARTSIRDPRVCAWCRSQDAADNDDTRWYFPEDEADFLDYMQIHSLPDQECEGKSNCRCRIVLVWGNQ